MKSKHKFVKILVLSSFVILFAHLIYKWVNGGGFYERENCSLYVQLNGPLFFLLENFLELGVYIIAGIFIAAVLEYYFKRKNFPMPGNIFTAFLLASILPVCACSVIPSIEIFKNQMRKKVLMVFVFAAPLLNPYVVFLSASVLGLKYLVIRVVLSFVLAYGMATVYVFLDKENSIKGILGCKPEDRCNASWTDVFERTEGLLKKLWPYILAAFVLSFAIAYLPLTKWLTASDLNSHIRSVLIAAGVGIPLYLCNGADIIIMGPLVHYSYIPLGTVLTFGLAANAICISSMVLYFKIIGVKQTLLLTAFVFVFLLLSGVLVNYLDLFLFRLTH